MRNRREKKRVAVGGEEGERDFDEEEKKGERQGRTAIAVEVPSGELKPVRGMV